MATSRGIEQNLVLNPTTLLTSSSVFLLLLLTVNVFSSSLFHFLTITKVNFDLLHDNLKLFTYISNFDYLLKYFCT